MDPRKVTKNSQLKEEEEKWFSKISEKRGVNM